MALGSKNQQDLRKQLALAVRGLQWSYAIFWSSSSSQPGVLEWGDGYYNGEIKTRKTVQMEETEGDQVGLQRSEQLRELYESLSVGHEQSTRPTAALSPEDLTQAEWYFLVCMSFVFTHHQGLPGRTFAENQTIWLCNAHRADTKVFSRSLLAKSASIQTIACFPHFGGVVELGTTELVLEDLDLIHRLKTSFLRSPWPTVSEIPTHVCDDELMDEMVSNCLNNSGTSSDCVSQSYRDPGAQNDVMHVVREGCQHNNSSGVQGHNENHYHSVVSSLLKNSHQLILGPYLRNGSRQSSFVGWRPSVRVRPHGGTHQRLLKKALFELARMQRDESSKQKENAKREVDDTDRNHVLSERKRRIKINERFEILGSLVPLGGKLDKVSILDHTIGYLRKLERRIEELQESNTEGTDNITVSVSDKAVLIEIRCSWKDCVMIDVMEAVSELRMESETVSSSNADGILSMTIKAKRKGLKAASENVIRQALLEVIKKK